MANLILFNIKNNEKTHSNACCWKKKRLAIELKTRGSDHIDYVLEIFNRINNNQSSYKVYDRTGLIEMGVLRRAGSQLTAISIVFYYKL